MCPHLYNILLCSCHLRTCSQVYYKMADITSMNMTVTTFSFVTQMTNYFLTCVVTIS